MSVMLAGGWEPDVVIKGWVDATSSMAKAVYSSRLVCHYL